jgi:prevent-host-death family protein
VKNVSDAKDFMNSITFSTAQANLAQTIDRVCDNHETLTIAQKGKQSVVMLSLEDYHLLTEVLPRLDELENGTVQRVSGDKWFNRGTNS